jgi:hypothetical protein
MVGVSDLVRRLLTFLDYDMDGDAMTYGSFCRHNGTFGTRQSFWNDALGQDMNDEAVYRCY